MCFATTSLTVCKHCCIESFKKVICKGRYQLIVNRSPLLLTRPECTVEIVAAVYIVLFTGRRVKFVKMGDFQWQWDRHLESFVATTRLLPTILITLSAPASTSGLAKGLRQMPTWTLLFIFVCHKSADQYFSAWECTGTETFISDRYANRQHLYNGWCCWLLTVDTDTDTDTDNSVLWPPR